MSAQTPPVYAGVNTTLPATGSGRAGTFGTGGGNSPAGIKGSWTVSGTVNGSSVSYNSDAGNSGGWAVSCSNSQITVSPPGTGTAPAGSTFKVTYATTVLFSGGDSSYYYGTGPNVTFQIAPSPPTMPAPGSPAFGWQGSVGGVNTGNGNKTTALPLVGWTQRGGLPVSCTLFHNSESTLASPAGPKWQVSYFTYLTNTGGNPTLI